MSRVHRILAAIVPPPKREWVRAHEAEYEAIHGRWRRWRWTVGVVPIVGRALANQLRHDPRSFLGGELMQASISALSIVNISAGLALLGLYASASSPPRLVLMVALALLIQGSYTVAFLADAFRARPKAARLLQLGGSTLALLVGAVGFGAGLLANIDSTDPEYGPMTTSLLIAAHGLASLLTFAAPRPLNTPSPQVESTPDPAG